MRIPGKRSVAIVTAFAAASTAAAFGLEAVEYKNGKIQFNGTDTEQNLDDHLNTACQETGACAVYEATKNEVIDPAADAIDNSPVIDDINDYAQNAADRPHDVAEACLRLGDKLRVTDKFEPRYEATEAIAATILAASTDGEVLANFDAFLDGEGVDFYFNSTEHPLELSPVDWATKGVDVDRINAARIDQNDPDYLNDLKIYTAGLVLGLGNFTSDFVNEQTDYLILTANMKDDATATAHEGLLDRGIVIEFDPEPTLEAVKERGVHELTHNFQYYIAMKLGFPFIRTVIEPYGPNVPIGFRYAEDRGIEPQRIVEAHPEYFLPGPERIFERGYSATNLLEHEATGVADMLVSGGILGSDSPSWGSPFHENQLGWLTCFSAAMPDFIDATIAHQLDIGLIGNPDAYAPYLELTTIDAEAVLAT
ncbi:MAG: hypothetical protein KIH63_004510 [Candidatus Saccharibacteria bacterium]|nr:hypothetical protein [Candidatus Saccharibacteria bacterium]